MMLLEWICGLRYSVKGIENIPHQNCIVMCKHQSSWETLALRAILPPNQTWILKRELLSIPFFGWTLRLFAPIAIDRNSGRKAIKQILAQGKASLDSGRWVIIFPEGTRTSPGERKKYGAGGGILATSTKRPVLPIAHNAGIFWKRRGLRKYPGTIEVVIGPLIDSEGKSPGELIGEVEGWIEDQMELLPKSL